MKVVLVIALFTLFIGTCLAACSCPSGGASALFDTQVFEAVTPTTFPNPSIVTRDFSTGKGYINILNKLIAAYGYNIKGVKSANDIDVEVDAVAFVMNVLTETTLQWFFAEAAVDVHFSGDGNVSFAGAEAGFLGFAARAFGIVEYEDTNGLPGFQLNDTVLGGYDLTSPYNILGSQWCNIDVSVFNYTDVNDVVLKVRSASVITIDGVFGFRVTSVGKYATIDGVKVDPNTIKIDFLINFYNNSCFLPGESYAKGASPSDPTAHPEAKIALITGFAAVAAAGAVGTFKTITQDPTGNTGAGVAYGVSAGASGAAAALYSYFTYKQNANITIIGGAFAEAAVVATKTALGDPTGKGFWNVAQALSTAAYAKWGTVDLAVFSFESIRPNRVYWDPSAGGNTPVSNFAGTYSSSILLMAIFAVLFALF